MVETNGKFYKNKIGNWQKMAQNGKRPKWSSVKFTLPPEKKAIPIECAYCGELKMAMAYHPRKKKIKFCSLEHGKLYMLKDPDTRFMSDKNYNTY